MNTTITTNTTAKIKMRPMRVIDTTSTPLDWNTSTPNGKTLERELLSLARKMNNPSRNVQFKDFKKMEVIVKPFAWKDTDNHEQDYADNEKALHDLGEFDVIVLEGRITAKQIMAFSNYSGNRNPFDTFIVVSPVWKKIYGTTQGSNRLEVVGEEFHSWRFLGY